MRLTKGAPEFLASSPIELAVNSLEDEAAPVPLDPVDLPDHAGRHCYGDSIHDGYSLTDSMIILYQGRPGKVAMNSW